MPVHSDEEQHVTVDLMTSALLTNFGRVLCYDSEHARVIQRAASEIDVATPVLWLKAAPRPTLFFRKTNGTTVDLSLPELIAAPGIVSDSLEVIPIQSNGKFPESLVGLRAKGRYLCSLESGEVNANATLMEASETFRLLSVCALGDLIALSRFDWVVAGTRELIPAGSVRLHGHEALHFGGRDSSLELLPLEEAERVDTETNWTLPISGVLFRDSWKHDKVVLYRPLIAFVLFGDSPGLHAQFRWSAKSLVEFGRYRGDVLVIGDQPRAIIEALLPEGLRDRLLIHPMRGRDRLDIVGARLAVGSIPELNAYQPILYSDVDVIFDRPLDEILAKLVLSERLSAQIEAGTVLGTTPSVGGTLFAEDPFKLQEKHGFCAGVLGLPSVRRAGWALRTASRALVGFTADRGRNSLPAYEQSMLNYSLRRLDMFDPEPITSATQITRAAANLNPLSPRGFVHFWPAAIRDEEMGCYFEMLTHALRPAES